MLLILYHSSPTFPFIFFLLLSFPIFHSSSYFFPFYLFLYAFSFNSFSFLLFTISLCPPHFCLFLSFSYQFCFPHFYSYLSFRHFLCTHSSSLITSVPILPVLHPPLPLSQSALLLIPEEINTWHRNSSRDKRLKQITGMRLYVVFNQLIADTMTYYTTYISIQLKGYTICLFPTLYTSQLRYGLNPTLSCLICLCLIMKSLSK
jgi:hypothetical protein